jgi:hypothetical protein
MAKRPIYPDDFKAFYSNYPKERQQGLKKPYEIWQRLKRDGILPPTEALIAAVNKQKLTRQWIEGGGRYVPMITTWLNQHRWEAEAPSMAEVEANNVRHANKDKIDAICKAQAEVLDEWHGRLLEETEYHKYNLSKFLPDGGAMLGGIVDIVIMNGITVFAPPEGIYTAFACVILDAFYDLLVLRAKGTKFSMGMVTRTLQEYPNTVLITVCGRYSDSLGIDALPEHVVLSEPETLNLRRILRVLLSPDLCTIYRKKYGYNAFFGTDTWLGAFSPDSVIENFREIL